MCLQQAAAGGLLPGAGPLRRKPPRNCLERSAALQAIAVLIAACALVRLMLACYAEGGLVRLLSERRVLHTLTAWAQLCLAMLSAAPATGGMLEEHC